MINKANPLPAYQNLIASLSEAGIDTSSFSSSLVRRLQWLTRYSPRLATLCTANPDIILPLLHDPVLDKPVQKAELREQKNLALQKSDNPEVALRLFHRTHLVRIAWRDLCDLDDIQVITEELSDLADITVEAVFDLVWTNLTDQYGNPRSESGREPSRMAVISMGKLGGRELNFSSDIDLMFVYDHSGKTDGGTESAISNESFFTLLAQGICDILAKSTPDGFFYRVDNRLRPEGDRGALAVPLMKVELYYHTYGQNWERQALLKARPVAGDKNVGNRFMNLVTPFTYRKYVDEVEVAEVLRGIDNLREKSLAQIGSPDDQTHNFKNGYGGIRDIEFFVQAVQLLYGGQYPEIKLTGTLVSLRRMYESHLLHSTDYDTLSSAYRFLRKIEHRLQMVADQQVYDLPKEDLSKNLFLSSLHFKSWNEFAKKYEKTTQLVRAIYQGVFQREEWKDNLDFLVDEEHFSDEIDSLLSYYELEDTRRAFAFLKELNKSPDLHLQPKTTRLFRTILPRLLLCLKKSPDPDLALSNFEKIVTHYRSRSALYQSLADQPPFLDLLVLVTSSSSFLTRLLLRDVSLLESIGRDGFMDEVMTLSLLEDHFNIIRQTYPLETHRDHLLRVQNAAMFRSGIRFILGLSDVEHMGLNLTQVADFVLRESMQPVTQSLSDKYHSFAEAHGDEIAVLGFGKLGGKEFNVASDCDLVFVYGDSSVEGDISSEEFFQRWGMKMIQYLEQKSPLGFLYHPDTRLRPHGKNGPQATSRKALAEYYHNDAQFWEKMALSRARFICGNKTIKTFLDELKHSVLFQKPPGRDEIQSILDMRKKIEIEKGEEKLKAGPGGIIDIEFIAQSIVLFYGPSHPSLRLTSTFEILRSAAVQEILPIEDSAQLLASNTFLRDVENRLRIVDNVSLDTLPSGDDLEKLTRRYAQHLDVDIISPEKFLNTIQDHTHKVRMVFQRFFDYLDAHFA